MLSIFTEKHCNTVKVLCSRTFQKFLLASKLFDEFLGLVHLRFKFVNLEGEKENVILYPISARGVMSK